MLIVSRNIPICLFYCFNSLSYIPILYEAFIAMVRFAIAESLPAVSAIPAFYYFISIVFDSLVLRDRSLTEVRV